LSSSFWQDDEGGDAFYFLSKQGEQITFLIGKIHDIRHSGATELSVSVKANILGRVGFAWESLEKIAFERAKSNQGLGAWITLEGDEPFGAMKASFGSNSSCRWRHQRCEHLSP
jgi:hypothetical protein